jgi:hypothetical protein
VNNNIIATKATVRKIRPNLFQLLTGEVIGFGTILVPGGLGYCFTCNEPDCRHVVTVDPQGGLAEPCADWLAGRHSVLVDDYGLPEPTL